MYFSRLIELSDVLLCFVLGFWGLLFFALLSFLVMLLCFSYSMKVSHLCFQISFFACQNLFAVAIRAFFAAFLLLVIDSAIFSIWFVIVPLMMSANSIPCQLSKGPLWSLLIWVSVHLVCICVGCVLPSVLLLHSSVIIVMNWFLNSVLLLEQVKGWRLVSFSQLQIIQILVK